MLRQQRAKNDELTSEIESAQAQVAKGLEIVQRSVDRERNQTATLASNKNASKAVRDKLKAQQAAAAAAICDESRRKTNTFTAKNSGPSTK